jgi:hypothetical protein
MLVIFITSCSFATGQNRLILEKKGDNRKKRIVKLDREYKIITNDSTYFSKIVGFTDSTISITKTRKTNRDTTYTYLRTNTIYTDTHLFKNRIAKDTTYAYTVVRPVYREDTISILFSNIKVLKRDLFKNRKWVEPFGWLALGVPLGILLLPVAAIDKGSEGVKSWLAFEAGLIAICGPPIFLGTRKVKYDLGKKWTLKTEL